MQETNVNALKPIELTVSMGGEGDYPRIAPWPWSYVKKSFQQNIAAAAYEEPATIEEISRKTGIPAYYVEKEVKILVDHELMHKNRNKYQTNFLILRYPVLKKIDQINSQYASKITETFKNDIENIEDDIRKIGFYDAGKDYKEQLWTILPFAFREAEYKDVFIPEKIFRPPKRKDGGRWYVHGLELLDLKKTGFSQNSCGAYNSKVLLTIYSTHNVSDKLTMKELPMTDKVELLYKIYNNDIELKNISNDIKDKITFLIQEEKKKKKGSDLKVKTLYLNQEQFNDLKDVFSNIFENYKDEFSALKEKIINTLNMAVPDHLKKQLEHYAPYMCFDIGAYIMKSLYNDNVLLPPKEPDTAGVVMLDKK